MRTIFRHQKPIQKDLQLLSNSIGALKRKPKQVHNGVGIPSNRLGVNGDLYVDKTEDVKVIYIKERGQWL